MMEEYQALIQIVSRNAAEASHREALMTVEINKLKARVAELESNAPD